MLKALIVDDEPLAHNVILAYLENTDFVAAAGQCYSATEALEFLQDTQVDLLFLDINMPLLSGLDLVKVLKNKPQIIITSAYSEYALESFDLDVTDYLLKPFPFERFLQACSKARYNIELRAQADSANVTKTEDSVIYLKVDKNQMKFELRDIAYFEAYGNYVKVWRDDKSLLTLRTLTSLEEELSNRNFLRIHKSYLINLDHIKHIGAQAVTLQNDMALNIGNAYKSCLIERTLNAGH